MCIKCGSCYKEHERTIDDAVDFIENLDYKN